jgi:hypothetical protein
MGGSIAIIAHRAVAVAASKIGAAVTSSNRIAPSAQMSERRSTLLRLRTCSGDM